MFVIVRHGNTFEADERPRRIGALTDLPLTAAGMAQAKELGQHFADEGRRFSRVLVSPLLRTRQTAQVILESVSPGILPEQCEWLREIDHGPDENMPEDKVLARVGRKALHAWDRHGMPPPGWTVDAEMRLTSWRALFAQPLVGSTLIVTSNGAARFALLADPTLFAESAGLHSMKLQTGGYGIIVRNANGVLDLPFWGRRP